MLVLRLLFLCVVALASGKVAPDEILLTSMRKYLTENGGHMIFTHFAANIRPQGWGISRSRFNRLKALLNAPNSGGQSTLNGSFAAGVGPLEPVSMGPSDHTVVHYILTDLGRTRDDVRRNFAISKRRAERLLADAKGKMIDRDIINFLRSREDMSKDAVLRKLRITEGRYARCVAQMRATTPVDRASVLRFLRAGQGRHKLDAMQKFIYMAREARLMAREARSPVDRYISLSLSLSLSLSI